ncbi:phytanoyl-CoA dioxygenase family protein [Neolewinella antarctica]|uniref:Ectoine hydroxylase-related dioxygenase (Phytanoyl-CoA dioxygenase family) n=1 Tax=Neolewinella antarctica TaxID=442734 RepID=A0ABX0XE72_9BACT|nr:phytanoyl-CoA dioxygenase family protein [Neolewinella antarctica]NJC27194.1 ectoine hydroxylase-related dioxygenase (phytanoyl-CoA dioxygenase family) [Neolewinella antarctica]
MIRRLKLAYSLYNFFHRKPLEHNLEAYGKLGIKKTYFSPVSSADFVGKDGDFLRGAEEVPEAAATNLYAGLDKAAQDSIDEFEERGYCVLPGFLDTATADRINTEIDELKTAGELEFSYNEKLMFAIRKSEFLSELWNGEDLLTLLSTLIKGRARLFQSINFLHGSQQKTHSDSIHMTTFPLGGLLGVWLALEDIELDNGPLHYYPGSHKMPYYLNTEYGNEGDWLLTGEKTYGDYETMIADKVAGTSYEKKVFLAKKGDLFIWHANLLHGGEPHLNPDRTRKSMVLHYFDANRVCYHEITQRPALFM